MTASNQTSQYFRDHELAKHLGVSVATVRRWRLLGTGPEFVKLGALVRYPKDAVQRFLEMCPRGGGKAAV